MNTLQPADFPTYFREIYDGRDPFPWQQRLAARVCGGNWPKCIALPTAAGKTACLDIAIFALAYQAHPQTHTEIPSAARAPRRIFFVVDRRVIVDQAFQHAQALAEKLSHARSGVLGKVAAALRKVAGCECTTQTCRCRPLDCYALRGGMYRESAWVRSPLQPTIITSTVDQVGSRLLFRGYGVSDSSKPLHAALIGNDSLILLDEAHCAKPFEQTITLVKKYRSWAKEPLPSPLHFVSMTATPSAAVAPSEIERDQADDHAHPVLGKRIKASKPATLQIATKATGSKWRAELTKKLASEAIALQTKSALAIGLIVNRVATARQTAALLRQELKDTADVVLLTGRMRPLDRDALMVRLEPLFSGQSGTFTKPIFVVATQCIEVGADLDFHALVTECASLDALRQRFGRLNRIAARAEANAAIIIRADQTEPSEDPTQADPVYGNSLANTWKWLNENARLDAGTTPLIDFGVGAISEQTKGLFAPETSSLNAPAVDAAVLLPAHLDMWCQTSPKPLPDPDPAYFLHGPQQVDPEVQVVFRADLAWDDAKSAEDNAAIWAETVSLCPPSSSESLRVRMGLFRSWLEGVHATDDTSDVDGETTPSQPDDDDADPAAIPVLRWSGPDSADTTIIQQPHLVRPNDVCIVPIATAAQRSAALALGDFPTDAHNAPMLADLGDIACQRARDFAILRLRRNLYPSLPASMDAPLSPDAEDSEIDARVNAAVKPLQSHPDETVRRAAKNLAASQHRTIKAHPLGGFVVIGKRRLHQFDPAFTEPEDSWVTAASRPYTLAQHNDDVARRARKFAQCSALTGYAAVLELAGQLHDIGKADPRFQALLHGGNRRKASLYPQPLAKSLVPLPRPQDQRTARESAGYPQGARHELISVAMASTSNAAAALDANSHDLLLHLIAAHHGHCRPFAPVVIDPTAIPVSYAHAGGPMQFMPDSATISGHGLERLDSGVAERFWQLTRRFGWWGLPSLESMLRLADWSCSEQAASEKLPGSEDAT